MRLAAASPVVAVLVLTACGGAAPGDPSGLSPAAASTPAGVTPPSPTPPGAPQDPPAPPVVNAPPAPTPPAPPPGPPGTLGVSHSFGDSTLQIDAMDGLHYIDAPAPGEPRIAGLVDVFDARSATPRPPPADVVVELNGVRLVRAVLNGAVSDFFFTVDPAGPQPTIGADGYLHLTASSASLGLTHHLDLACPFGVGLAGNPAEGASLAGAASLSLAWTALPQNPPSNITVAAFAGGPRISLYERDAATGALGARLDMRPVAQDAPGGALLVKPTAMTGYLAELRFPGIVYLDAHSGGFCGRTARLAFAN